MRYECYDEKWIIKFSGQLYVKTVGPFSLVR